MSGSRPTSFGEMLRTFRIHAGLSQEALSDAAGVSVHTISDLERGQRHSAHLETVRLLSSALELTSDERRLLFEAARANGAPAAVSQVAPARSIIGNVRWTATIPASATPLVGRTSELEVLATVLIPGSGLVTLTGLGGAGKTRLAIERSLGLTPRAGGGIARPLAKEIRTSSTSGEGTG